MRVILVALLCLSFAVPVWAAKDAGHAVSHYGDAHAEVSHHVDVHADDHGGGHDEVQGLPQLDPTWYVSQFFWLAVMFAIMHLAFRFKVLPDLSNVIERRREQIENDLTSAKNLKEESERVHAEYEDALAKAREKSSALFTRVEVKIKEKEQEEYAAFSERSSKAIAEAEADIKKAKKVAFKDMNGVAAEIAMLAAKQIVGVSTDAKQAASVIEDLGKKRAA